MFDSYKIICFLIILAKIQSVYGSTHAVIGNYSELNPKDCGITRFTPNLDFNCFKWHKNTIGKMKGRNVTENEVPWIVYFAYKPNPNKYACCGVMIANQWMLTAAHCLPSVRADDYTILPGHHSYIDKKYVFWVNATEVHKHPKYSLNVPGEKAGLNDLGLIKFDKTINLIRAVEGNLKSNDLRSICLPQKNIFNDKDEFALSAGWGRAERYSYPLQIGFRKILPSDDYSFWYSSYTITTVKLDNQFIMCRGDSGGPLWQYSDGRAVLIGIMSFGIGYSEITHCEFTGYHPNVMSAYFRISKYIDWIKAVTKLN